VGGRAGFGLVLESTGGLLSWGCGEWARVGGGWPDLMVGSGRSVGWMGWAMGVGRLVGGGVGGGEAGFYAEFVAVGVLHDGVGLQVGDHGGAQAF
jgi:hypothetical protein